MIDPFKKIIQITQLQHPLYAVFDPVDGDKRHYIRPVWHLAVMSDGDVCGVGFDEGLANPIGEESNFNGLFDFRDMEESDPLYLEIIDAISADM